MKIFKTVNMTKQLHGGGHHDFCAVLVFRNRGQCPTPYILTGEGGGGAANPPKKSCMPVSS